jgi:FkbM family methyltransferase
MKPIASLPRRAIFFSYLTIRRFIVRITLKIKGITYYKPNYIFLNRFTDGGVVVDVGCGWEADFSILMIERYSLDAYGVDPTRKHAPALKILEEKTRGKFHHLPFAVSGEKGYITFHESRDHESGSILTEHTNIQSDDTFSYEVESLTIDELVRRIGTERVDILKLDLEGAEYSLLKSVTGKELEPFNQIFIEFHHHCTDYTRKDTRKMVKRITGNGFRVFSLDLHNYLFYREQATS